MADIRGFKDIDEHDEHIISVWNKQVTKRDTVYMLGDISASKYERALEIIQSLNGVKHLVAGNHDPVHPMHRSAVAPLYAKWLETFQTITPFVRKTNNGRDYLLSHFPYAEWGDGPSRAGQARYLQYRLPNLGVPLLHGHTHGPERDHDNMLHVGWDAWGKLVPLHTVAEWLENQPTYTSFNNHLTDN